MTEPDFTRPATWEDLKLVARVLNQQGARYALIGGYAIAAHGYNRFSEDLDILVDPAPDNTRRWIAALSALPDGACRELVGQDDLFQRDGEYAIRINDEFTVDVMPSACGHGYAELAPHIEQRDIDGVQIPVLGLEGLLLTKEGMREKDRADRRVIEEALAALKRRSR
ncbi:MAG TPA: nucleotidyl transferase AbiEii/AbiGii toxin family protein [Polyangiaceae bacterium]|nr:nucleotidyl transferase AbiEii/AbiGii toxin family protein [Polyangiaceae bacterium]